MKDEKKNYDKRKYFDLKDRLTEKIYKNVNYDPNKLNLIVRINPTMIKINFQIFNDGFLDTYGYAIYPNKEKDKSIIDLDEDIIMKRVEIAIKKLNEINQENNLEVIK